MPAAAHDELSSILEAPPLTSRTESENVTARHNTADAGNLRERFAAVRQMTEQLTRPLSSEDCQVQSMPDCSPAKWHLAHTSWFFETFVLAASAPGFKPFDPSFNYLFNSYYNAVGDRLARPNRGLITRPSLDDVYAYRASVDRAMESFLDSTQAALDQEVAAVIELGLNHEQQHQELILTDLKHALAQNPLRPAYRNSPAASGSSATEEMQWSFFPGVLAWVGHDGGEFAFDNEAPRHRVYLRGYQLCSRLVTCGEFIEFIEDRGYARPELWLSDGWNIVNARTGTHRSTGKKSTATTG